MATVPASRPADLAHASRLEGRAREFAENAHAKNTRRGYASDWACFSSFCQERGVESLPATPATVVAYLVAMEAEGLRIATLERRLASISQSHRLRGKETPTRDATVQATMSGARRTLGVAQIQKAPAVLETLAKMLATLPTERTANLRDRAVLLIGFAGAFRRSELVALDVADVAFSRSGATVTIRRSKADQDGEGRKIGIPFAPGSALCPVQALGAWLGAARITEGAIFRGVSRSGRVLSGRLTGHSVALIVKRSAEAAGLDAKVFAGHSLRAGLATSAAAAGASERAIMAQTGHRGVTMVRRYIRDGELFRENAASAVFGAAR